MSTLSWPLAFRSCRRRHRETEDEVEDDRHIHLSPLPTTATPSALPPAHLESLIGPMDAAFPSLPLPPQSLIDAMRVALWKKPRHLPQAQHPSSPPIRSLLLQLITPAPRPDQRPQLAPAERPARRPHHLRQRVLWRRNRPGDSGILTRHLTRDAGGGRLPSVHRPNSPPVVGYPFVLSPWSKSVVRCSFVLLSCCPLIFILDIFCFSLFLSFPCHAPVLFAPSLSVVAFGSLLHSFLILSHSLICLVPFLLPLFTRFVHSFPAFVYSPSLALQI